MLAWYKQLLELRRKFVVRTSRTCHAYLSHRKIVVEMPAETRSLVLRVHFPGTPVQQSDEEIDRRALLHSDEDGYTVAIVENQSAAQALEAQERIA